MATLLFCGLQIWPTFNLDALPFVVFFSLLNTLTVLRIGHGLLLPLLVATGLYSFKLCAVSINHYIFKFIRLALYFCLPLEIVSEPTGLLPPLPSDVNSKS